MTSFKRIHTAPSFELIKLRGPMGYLECLRLDSMHPESRGIALIAHPDPTEGGTFTNKVVHTIAKALARQGFVAYCPNFRGVGNSEGLHDLGVGEVDDMAAVLSFARLMHPGLHSIILAGFSFGTFIQSRLRQRLPESDISLILVGPAVSRYIFPTVPPSTLIIHGEQDEVIPLACVLDWARSQHQAVTVLPGAGHFFHGYLPELTRILMSYQWIT